MKTIVFATDFSEQAEHAGAYAVMVARRLGAELLCVHASVYHDVHPDAYELSTGHIEGFREELQRELVRRRMLLETMVEGAGRQGVRASHEVVEGRAAEAICQVAADAGADLIVVGSHGRTGLKRFLLGSVAERVVRLASCSVLVARRPLLDEQGFHRVLVPIDFEPGSRVALEQARMLAANDAVMDLVHCWFVDGTLDGAVEPGASPAVYRSLVDIIVDDARTRGRELVALAAGAERTVSVYLQEGRPAGAIQTFIDRQEPSYDLVAVGTHGRRGLDRALLGSVAEATVRYSPCSVLVARPR